MPAYKSIYAVVANFETTVNRNTLNPRDMHKISYLGPKAKVSSLSQDVWHNYTPAAAYSPALTF